jgi:hypothetical protein
MTASTCRSRAFWLSALWTLAVISASCGGGSAHNNSMAPISTLGENVQPIVVNSGPANNYANGVFSSVTVCVPSSSTCQTIGGILVDTGSFGLRILSSAGGGPLNLSLPQQNGVNGNPIGECAPFVSGYTWGPVKMADISMAGEQATNIPVQIIDPTFASVPAGCKNTGVPADDTLQTLGANGILGIGPFAEDCGRGCEQNGSGNPGLYYECASSSCQVTAQSLAKQVQNPVASFAQDNNGVIIQLPAVTTSVASLSGSMVFGIGTESNNGIGNAHVFPLNSNGEFTTAFQGKSYPSFVDSGSNALFFLDTATTAIPECTKSSGFYCPSSTLSLTAVTSSGSRSETISFSAADAETLFSNGADFVFSSLTGPNPGTFDWGLPFFYGRNVFTAIEARSTPAGTGPFWAY